jgi:hypothetical protein
MNNISKKLFLLSLLISIIFSINTVEGQINRSKLRNNFSKSGKSVAVIRHGITTQLSYDYNTTPFIGIGYNASQYFGIGNRFMQQSITYQLGLQIKKLGNPYQSAFIHNLTASFHCTYIGTADLSPFLYGLTIHFATAKDTNVYEDPHDANTKKGEFMSNIYLRPEIGFTFPIKYSAKTQERKPFTFSITYGYNIGLFMRRMELAKDEMELAKDEMERLKNEGIEVDYPWTAKNHHILTLRFNFNFVHYREFQ